MRIVAVGDIMPGGIWSGKQGQFASEQVLEVLRQADIRVGTLETAIGDEPTFYEEKMARAADVIYAKDADLARLKELDINLVSLANNHFFDLGPEGAAHAIDLLDYMGIKHCGAGRNLEEASRPVVYEFDGKTIAFLAFCDWRAETVGWCPFATDEAPGVNPMYDDYVVSEISKYKKQYDYIAVIPHWGKEHTFVTTGQVYKLANKMVKAGADLILGGHTHRIQPVVKKKTAIIAYSMGNFFFPDRLIVKPRSTYYPNGPLDISQLPTTDRYPFVDDTTLKIWKPLARIGMIAVTELDRGKMSEQSFFVKLDDSNCLKTYRLSIKTRLPLHWQKFFLMFMPYTLYEWAVRMVKRTVKRIKKLR